VTLRPESEPVLSIAQLGAILLSVLSLQIGISGYCFGKLEWNAMASFIVSALLLITFVFVYNYLYLLAGLAIFIVAVAWRMNKRGQRRAVVSLDTSD